MTDTAPRTALVLEDDIQCRTTHERQLRKLGLEVVSAPSLAEARALLERAPVDLALVDFELPDGDGPELARWGLATGRIGVAYCVTGCATTEHVVQAVRAGCANVLEKPLDVRRIVELTGERRAADGELDDDRLRGWRRRVAPELIGDDPALLDLLRVVANVAPTQSTVLISGESGAGKELIARALHDGSPRRDKPFVALNCAAIPEALFEAELFGHARGAFTSAVEKREGHLSAAHGGTLFLDEIGDMPLAAQAKLLRVLQDQKVVPLGSDRPVPINVRIVAATNKSLEEAVEAGAFRADLFFRLNVIPLELPPLRERPDDVMALARFFLARANQKHEREVTGFDAAAEQVLRVHPWPGNVRELANTVERAVILTPGGVIQTAALGLGARKRKTPPHGMPVVAPPAAAPAATPESLALRPALDAVERRLIEEALERTGGNRSEAAALLGLNRTTLVEKIRKFA